LPCRNPGARGSCVGWQARVEIQTLRWALESFRGDYGRFPSDQEGLDALPHPPDEDHGPYIKKRVPPKDPWDRAYIYRSSPTGDRFTLYSSGRNGVDEQGEGDDIVSGQKKYACEEYGVGCPCDSTRVVAVIGSLFLGVGLAFYGIGLLVRRLRRPWWSHVEV